MKFSKIIMLLLCSSLVSFESFTASTSGPLAPIVTVPIVVRPAAAPVVTASGALTMILQSIRTGAVSLLNFPSKVLRYRFRQNVINDALSFLKISQQELDVLLKDCPHFFDLNEEGRKKNLLIFARMIEFVNKKRVQELTLESSILKQIDHFSFRIEALEKEMVNLRSDHAKHSHLLGEVDSCKQRQAYLVSFYKEYCKNILTVINNAKEHLNMSFV